MLTFFKTTDRILLKTVHYWSGNTLTIYHPDSSTKRVYNLKKPINEYSDSIAYLNRIFIMGGNGPSAETFEDDYKEVTRNNFEAYNDCEKYKAIEYGFFRGLL